MKINAEELAKVFRIPSYSEVVNRVLKEKEFKYRNRKDERTKIKKIAEKTLAAWKRAVFEVALTVMERAGISLRIVKSGKDYYHVPEPMPGRSWREAAEKILSVAKRYGKGHGEVKITNESEAEKYVKNNFHWLGLLHRVYPGEPPGHMFKRVLEEELRNAF